MARSLLRCLLLLVLAEGLKPSGQEPPPCTGIAARPHTPGSPAPVFAADGSLCSVQGKHGLGRCGGNTLPLRGAPLPRGGMLRLVLCFLSEIEAKKACAWLRAAGFPQYAQLYEGESRCLPLIPAPAPYLGSGPASQPNTGGGCEESSQGAAERRGWTERVVY